MNEELKIIISAETEKLKKGVDEAKGALGTFKSEISKNKEELKKTWTSVGEGATKASKTIITSVGAIGGALIGTAALTTDYREE